MKKITMLLNFQSESYGKVQNTSESNFNAMNILKYNFTFSHIFILHKDLLLI